MKIIVVKTKMKQLPKSCKECDLVVIGGGIVMCPVSKNWLEIFEINAGETKLKECPLEVVQDE